MIKNCFSYIFSYFFPFFVCAEDSWDAKSALWYSQKIYIGVFMITFGLGGPSWKHYIYPWKQSQSKVVFGFKNLFWFSFYKIKI